LGAFLRWEPEETMERAHSILPDITAAIGQTPLVRINRVLPEGLSQDVQILAKLEWFNPVGSVKERIALALIEAAERSGALKPGKVVIESTSGNTGIGVAMVCAAKGYELVITMSEKSSVERRQVLKALGATLVLTPAESGGDGAWDRADAIAASDSERYCRIRQYDSEANPDAHYRTTAEEIHAHTGGRVDAFVAGMGTTGTLMGVGRRFRELYPSVKLIGVEPQPKGKQQGIRNLNLTRAPRVFDPELPDERIVIEDEEAFRLARRLCREEGLFVGISCGSAMAGAWRVAKTLTSGNVVVVFPDDGYKYLSTELYAD
jgi:cysteine synthase